MRCIQVFMLADVAGMRDIGLFAVVLPLCCIFEF